MLFLLEISTVQEGIVLVRSGKVVGANSGYFCRISPTARY